MADRPDTAAAAIRVATGFAIAKLALHLSMLTRYGKHRDEYYFQDCAHFLDFGYVDHAPAYERPVLRSFSEGGSEFRGE